MNISKELARDIKREVLKSSYFEFFKWAFDILHPGQPYKDNFHVKYLCDVLQEEVERMLRNEEKDKDLLINIPPRTSKSLIFSVCFLPWAWLHMPNLKFITVSFDAQLALLNSQLSRDIIAAQEFQELFGDIFYIRPDIDSKGLFTNNFGGYRLSRTTGQNCTGFSAHIILVDDPDSAMSVYSENERSFVHKYYFEALYNRLTPPDFGFRAIIQQRLHEMDLTGAVLERQPTSYHHICLPAEVTSRLKPASLQELYVDGLLDPNRLHRGILSQFKQTLGTNNYTGQYLQAPAPDEGGIFKKEWFDIVEAHTLQRDPMNHPVHFILDTAYTDKQQNDPTAIFTCFVKDNILYILDVQEVWMEFPVLVEHIKTHAAKFQYNPQASKFYIEGKASGKSIIQQLKISTMFNIIELEPKGSKIERANSITPICEGRRVKIVNGPYKESFLNQLTAFPNAAHDDQVDTLVYGVQRLLQKSDSPDFHFFSF